MNWAQQALLADMHSMNCILKARQLGFSSFIQLIMLDARLFHRQQDAVGLLRIPWSMHRQYSGISYFLTNTCWMILQEPVPRCSTPPRPNSCSGTISLYPCRHQYARLQLASIFMSVSMARSRARFPERGRNSYGGSPRRRAIPGSSRAWRKALWRVISTRYAKSCTMEPAHGRGKLSEFNLRLRDLRWRGREVRNNYPCGGCAWLVRNMQRHRSALDEGARNGVLSDEQ